MTIEAVVAGTSRLRAFLGSLAVALATTVGGVVIGFLSIRGASQGELIAGPSHMSFWAIIGRNLSTALLLYSGVCTAGVTTLLAGVLLGGYVGATFGAAVTAVGLARAAGSILWYAPLEMVGLLLAAVAGLTPVVTMLVRRPGSPRFRTYTDSLAASLRLGALAAAVLVVAAILEAILIGYRS
jgi:uncharacterized membrane protein SpoIIM required for sporulation